jgi:hypothetical protein
VVVTVAPIAITITVLESLVMLPCFLPSPRLLPRIRLLCCEGTLPAKLLIPLPSIVVTGNIVAIRWRTELNAHSKLLCLRLRRSRQRNRARDQTNRYALHYHRLYAREFHNNLLLTSH